MTRIKLNNFLYVLIVFFIMSCSTNQDYEYYPKPLSGQKIVMPSRDYKIYDPNCNYKFDIPKYAFVDTIKGHCNGDLILEPFNATLFLTYVPINDTNLIYNIEYSRKLAYDHSIKADAIDEAVVKFPNKKVYGMQYKITGNAASPYQFYLTDSSQNFLRVALYFNVAPNYDSLKPAIDFVMEDFDHLIKSVEWK